MRYDRQELHKKKLLSIKNIITWIILLIAIFGIYEYSFIGNAIVPRQEFNINSTDRIGTLQEKLNFSVNYYLYKIWISVNYPKFNLQIGNYSISQNITLNELFDDVLKHPNSKDIKVTILPGWNIFDIDAYLSDNRVIKSGELIAFSKNITADYIQKYKFLSKVNSIEGFIYPDTYRLPVDSNLDIFLKVVLDEFKSKIYDKYGSSNKFYDNMILTSILEREEKNPTNKPIVAGILKKRLSENIAIGADATVCYQYELTQKQCTPSFIGDHIYIKSSYNTRSKIGLPPTPISNFTDDTMDAVINSQISPYYYYLHDSDGNIHYGKTLDEHNRNRVEYMN